MLRGRSPFVLVIESKSSAGNSCLELSAADLASDSRGFARLRHRILAFARSHPNPVIDLGRTSHLGAAEIAVLAQLASEADEAGLNLSISGIGDRLKSAIESATKALAAPAMDLGGEPEILLERVGEEALVVVADLRGWRRFVIDALRAMFIEPFHRRSWKWNALAEQMELIGVRGTPIVVFISLLVGTVLALNGALQLRQFGASIFIANLVGVAMTREMGPLITAVIIAGRSGSAIAAELGTMVVAEEIDAMKTMALEPYRFLLAPRILALLLTLPCLTVLSDLSGIAGGYLVGVVGMGLGSGNFLRQTSQALFLSDLVTGLAKSLVYALLIGLISCYEGVNVTGGAQGVGAATTRAVVSSIVAAIIADAVFTLIFYATG